ncbi:MAG: DUF1275 domain-containing protein [Thaumarchaeota archaeon]|nr:DUF1275 domain-containing protein [Nitrososphaerota archaeon]
MSGFFADVRETLFPSPGGKDGPLPPLLVAMTVVTGLVDAFSYLVLGHVFVANMTGNVLFIAFALAGARGFSIASSLTALGAFVVGSLTGGKLGSRLGANRGRLLWTATEAQALLLGLAAGLSILSGSPVPAGYGYALIVALGISMGIQNATARKLAVPDLTTTVLTLTLTGMVADSRAAGGAGSKAGRRLVSVLAMFAGALTGVLAILYVSDIYPLLFAFVVIALVSLTGRVLSARTLF